MPGIDAYPRCERCVRVRDREIILIGPANYESLIDDPDVVSRFAQDEFMPYWAEFWPAARLLAEEVAGWEPLDTSGDRAGAQTSVEPTVLEIGCGLGLVGLVAHSLGYRVTLTDYHEDALAFVRASAARNDLPEPATAYVDWRLEYPALRSDRILGAEVLYEQRNLAAVAEFVKRHLNPGGFALFVDGNRQVADAFPAVAERCGLRVAVEPVSAQWSDMERVVAGRFFRITL